MKEGQSVLAPAVSQVPLIHNNQYAEVEYLGVAYSLLQPENVKPENDKNLPSVFDKTRDTVRG